MKELKVNIIARINGKDVAWEKLNPKQRKEIAEELHIKAMKAAGYEVVKN